MTEKEDTYSIKLNPKKCNKSIDPTVYEDKMPKTQFKVGDKVVLDFAVPHLKNHKLIEINAEDIGKPYTNNYKHASADEMAVGHRIDEPSLESNRKPFTRAELDEFDRMYEEDFTPAWESEGQYCRAGGGQYEKSFAWWGWRSALSFRQEEIKKLIAENTKLIKANIEVAQINADYLFEKMELQEKLSKMESSNE